MSFHQMTYHIYKKKNYFKDCKMLTTFQDKNRLEKTILFLSLGFMKGND